MNLEEKEHTFTYLALEGCSVHPLITRHGSIQIRLISNFKVTDSTVS